MGNPQINKESGVEAKTHSKHLKHRVSESGQKANHDLLLNNSFDQSLFE